MADDNSTIATVFNAACASDAAHDEFELSQSQKLILMGQQLEPDKPLYNMVLTFRIKGELNHRYFKQAFQAVVDRCDALRTVFINTKTEPHLSNNSPKQRVLLSFNYVVELVDFSTEEQPEIALKEWIDIHKKYNFDIERCLFESVLIKLAENEYCWYLNQHHLLTDAWSMAILFKNMQGCYALVKQGQLEQGPQIPDFQHYVSIEKTQQSSKQFAVAQKYWQQQLSSPVIASTFYRPTPPNKQGVTKRIPCEFGIKRSLRLRQLAQQEGFTSFSVELSIMQLFSTLLFAYLYRISGNTKLSIGTPIHSRTSQQLKETVGLLINIFPLQIEVEEHDSFSSLYNKVAKANQQLLINAIPGSADFEQSREFDVLLNYIPSSFGEFDQLPTTSEWVHSDSGDRNHLLRLQIHNFDQKDQFSLFIDLNDEMFVGEEKQWVCQHFLCLVDALLDDAEQQLAAPALMLDSIVLPYQTEPVQSHNDEMLWLSVVDLFDEQVNQHGSSNALECGQSTINYQQLEQRSNDLAHWLCHEGVKQGSVVAFLTERSIDAVTAILGILKSGAAFLAIDASYPPERIAYILDDANVLLILTDVGNNSVGLQFNPSCFCIETALKNTAQCKQSIGLLPNIKPGDTAYIIYTSGSTGRPKGVVVSHGGLSNYIVWARDYYQAGKILTFALFSSFSFDLTITSLFVPLVSGGKLVIYPESDDAAGITIRSVIEDNRVDIIKLTPAHLALIQVMDFSTSRLQKLIVGGDEFKTELAQRLSKYFGGKIDIYNEYGPTEATVGCTVHKYHPANDQGAAVPIGKPIRHANIYIYDRHLNSVPQGITGEIYIAGVGLASGYLNQAELTQASFIDDPNQAGSRLYKSGDLARFNASGEIEYLGRNDQQVKVQGVRIETGEVEAALLGIGSITEAIVDIAEHLTLSDENHELEHCIQCGLAANHPSAQLNDEKVCRICRIYQQQQQQADSYYRDLDQLKYRITKIKRQSKGKQDCIMLLSGGKDSSYALCKLVDLGLTPLVFTLNNGFISEGATANIKRLVDRLGLELIVGETAAMNAIFVDSLKRFSNVCNGCFKTIYTLSMNIASERGIKVICTGLSRGQIFETRVAHLFQQGCFDPSKIDRRIIDARKAYHRTQDIIATTLDVEIFKNDNIFDQIQYLDFYRYTDVTLEEIYQYLNNIAPWIRPSDTGRSTNCLINDAGIYIHKKERGYHNYALPYSWDVRLGHKDRNAALDELNDEIDQPKVDKILKEVGYQVRDVKTATAREDKLIAYYVSPAEIQKNTLQKHLSKSLPSEFIPTQFVWLSALPLTTNGKVDRQALPRPRNSRRELTIDYVAPATDVETSLTILWSTLLGVEEVGVADNFFDLGGDSIVNIQIVAAAREQGIELTPQQIFDYPTIKELAQVAATVVNVVAEHGSVTGNVPLLPSQARFFNEHTADINHFAQSVALQFGGELDTEVLLSAFTQLMRHHDGLRSCFSANQTGWLQLIKAPDEADPMIEEVQLTALKDMAIELDNHVNRLVKKLDIASGKLVAAANIKCTDSNENYLIIVIHHLVVDGVSWWVLLADLEQCYSNILNQKQQDLADKTCSVKQWGSALAAYAKSSKLLSNTEYWTQSNDLPGKLPARGPGNNQINRINDKAKQSDLMDAHLPSSYSSKLSASLTQQLIHELPSAFSVQVPEVLLTAILQTLLPWSGNEALRIEIEGHGRESLIEGVDVTRTISWFTSFYPLLLRLGATKQLGDDLKAVKQQLRSVPKRGIEYGLIRYLSGHEIANSLVLQPQADVLFNYMGQWQRTLAQGSKFTFVSPIQAHYGNDRLKHRSLEINAMVFDGQLHLDWTFDSCRYSTALISQLSAQLIQSLQSLIQFCLATDDSGFTPSDFAADIEQTDLDDIFDEFGE